MLTATANLTDLLRHPKDVLEQVRSAGQVRVKRRGDSDLVILRSDRLEAITAGARLVAQLTRSYAANGNNMKAALQELYAWTTVFDDVAMEQYAVEMKQWVFAAAQLESYEKLLQLQSSWRGTAEAYAQGYQPVEIDPDFFANTPPVERP